MKEKFIQSIQGPHKNFIMVFIITALYLLGMYFSLSLLKSAYNFSIFFVPSGIAIGLALVYGYRAVFVIAVAKILYYIITGSDLSSWAILITSLASAVEAFVGLYVYRSLINKNNGAYSYSMTIAVALIAPILSSLIGVWHRTALEGFLINEYFQSFYVHYTGDVLGILIILPLFINIKEQKDIKIFDYISPFIALFISYIYDFQFSSPYSVLILMAIFIPAFFGTNFGLSFTAIIVSAFLNWGASIFTSNDSAIVVVNNLLRIQIFMLAFALFSLSIQELKNAKLFKTAYRPLLVLWFFIGLIFYYNDRTNDVYSSLYISQKIHSVEVILAEKVKVLKILTTGNEALVNASDEVTKEEWLGFQKAIEVHLDTGIIRTQSLIKFDSEGNPEFFTISYDNDITDADMIKLLGTNIFEKYYYKSANYSELVMTPPQHIYGDGREKRSIYFMIKANKVGEQIKSFSIVGFCLKTLFSSSIYEHFKKLDIDIYESNLTKKDNLVFSQRATGSPTELDGEPNSIVSHFRILNATFKIHWNDTFNILINHDNISPIIILIGSLVTLLFTFFLMNKRMFSLSEERHSKSFKSKLHAAEQKYELLFESSFDAVIIFSLQEIVSANKKALEILNIQKVEEVQGLAPSKVLGLRLKENLSDPDFFKSKILEANLQPNSTFKGFILTNNNPIYASIVIQKIHIQDQYRYLMIIHPLSEHQSTNVITTTLVTPVKEVLSPLKVATVDSTPLPIKTTEGIKQHFKGQRVLLVEDNEVNVLMTKKYLEKWGLTVDVAPNGEIAVEKSKAQKYALILMDIHMPIMDGYEATRIIRQTNRHVPIVALSADVLNNLSEEHYFVKFTDFIPKPFRPDDFLEKMKLYIK